MWTQLPTKSNIYLMGFMGTGKSRVGRLLAQKLKRPFLDTDACIAEETGISIPDIFAEQGEKQFRILEKTWVKRVSELESHVVSLGGGAIIDAENWNHIIHSGITVTLSYPIEIIAFRLSKKRDRPLLGETKGKERLKKIENLLEKRRPFYHRADLVLHLNHEVEAERIASTLYTFFQGKI
jgi:shikimate kinase